MSTLKKFQRARKLIPSEENIDNRDFVLLDNALYFAGDRTWFMIENFMDSSVNCRLSYQELMPILSMQGEVTARYAGGNTVAFTNGKHVLTLRPVMDAITIPHEIAPLEPHEYHDLPEILARGKSIFPLINEFASVCVMTIEEGEGGDPLNPQLEGYLALLNDKTFAVLKGEPGLDMDLTDIPEVIQGLIAQKAKVNMDVQIVNSMIEDEKYTIYASFKHGKNRYPEKRKTMARDIARGLYEHDTGIQPVIRVEVEAKELIDLLPVLNNLQHQSTMQVHCVNDIMHVTILDTINNTFTAHFPCALSEEIKAEIPIIDRAIIDFLVSSSGSKMNEATIRFCFNVSESRLIVRSGAGEGAVNSVCMLKLIA